MKLWLEVFVEPCPPHTGMYVAQEVVRHEDGSIKTTYLASAVDRYGIMNEINALGYRENVTFVNKPTEDEAHGVPC